MAPVAIAFAVLELTGSVSDLGIVLATRSLAITALVLAGGVFADRISPRLAMLWADLTRVVVMGAIAALLIADAAEVWQLALLYGVEGIATAFFTPASSALVPQIVSGARLQDANALLNLSGSAGQAVGPALAGILLAIGTPGGAIAFDAATFAISAAFLLGVRAPRLRTEVATSFRADLKEGWSEFSARTWLWVAVLSAAITNAVFFPAFQVLGPTVAEESLGGSSAWALIAAAFGVGALAGGILGLRARPRRPLFLGEGVVALFALPIALLAIPSTTAVLALGALVAGVGVSLAEILYDTVAGQHIPQAAMSRVYAYDWFGSLALEPLGLALIGPIALGFGTSPTLWAAAAVLVTCQACVVLVPSVRRLEFRPEPIPREPSLPPIEPGS
jgi:MFS family permease